MGYIRLLLAISVVIAHSSSIFGITLVGGELAVQAFFIISGFYMALILNEKYVGSNYSYSYFITNRLLRLYPVYWIVLIFAVLLSIGSFIKSGTDGSQKISLYLQILKTNPSSIFTFAWIAVADVFMIFQDWFIFLGIDTHGSNIYWVKNFHTTSHISLSQFLFLPQSWTIGIEISFYLMAPFLSRLKNGFLLFILIISLLIKILLYTNGFNYDPWTYRFFPAELSFFLIGIFAYRVYFAKIKNKQLKCFKVLEHLSFLIFLAATFLYKYFSNYQIAGIIYPYLIALLIPFIFNKFKNNKTDSWIGELSYPIYITHITLLIVLQKSMHLSEHFSGLILTVTSIIVSIVINATMVKKINQYRINRKIVSNGK